MNLNLAKAVRMDRFASKLLLATTTGACCLSAEGLEFLKFVNVDYKGQACMEITRCVLLDFKLCFLFGSHVQFPPRLYVKIPTLMSYQDGNVLAYLYPSLSLLFCKNDKSDGPAGWQG